MAGAGARSRRPAAWQRRQSGHWRRPRRTPRRGPSKAGGHAPVSRILSPRPAPGWAVISLPALSAGPRRACAPWDATITRSHAAAAAEAAGRRRAGGPFPLFCLAPRGVCRASRVAPGSGELLPPRFTLTRRPLVLRPVLPGGLFSVALSVAGDAVSPVPRLSPGALPCGVRTFLEPARTGPRPPGAWQAEPTPTPPRRQAGISRRPGDWPARQSSHRLPQPLYTLPDEDVGSFVRTSGGGGKAAWLAEMRGEIPSVGWSLPGEWTARFLIMHTPPAPTAPKIPAHRAMAGTAQRRVPWTRSFGVEKP
jgi:hypothetical protein